MTLELKDLTDEERIALVAIVHEVAEADTYVTDDEATKLHSIIVALGKESYQAAVAEVDHRFVTKDTLRRFLHSIDRQAARELIYETALELALSDTAVQPETDILDWLAGIWHIKVRVDSAGGRTSG